MKMDKVPNIISTKDLSYIKDILNWEFILIKKINHYDEFICDKEIKKLINKCNNKHKEHYNKLLEILN